MRVHEGMVFRQVLAGALMVASFGVLPASAQTEWEIRYVDVGTIWLDDMREILPGLIYRPFDDQGTRPGGDAMGMGGAYAARAEGPIAVGWNPAGITALDHAAFAVDGFATTSSSNVPDYPDTLDFPVSGELRLGSYEAKLKGGIRAGFIGGSMPLWRQGNFKLAGALSWRRYVDTQMPEDLVAELQTDVLNSLPIVMAFERTEEGALEAYTPTLAAEVMPGVSIGANLNILRGHLRMGLHQRIATGGAVLEGNGSFHYRYSGISTDLGLRLQTPGKRVMFSAQYTPGYSVDVDGGEFTMESLPRLGDTGYIVVIALAKVADHDMKIPPFYGLGLEVRPLSRLALAGAYESRAWSDLELTHRPGGGRAEVTEKGVLPLIDAGSLHLGAEYLLFRPSWGDWFVRAGLRTSVSSFREISPADTTAPGVDFSYHGEKIEPTAYSFGVSLTTAGIRYDFGWETWRFDERRWFLDSPSDPLTDPDSEEGDAGPRMVTVERAVNRLRLSGTYAF